VRILTGLRLLIPEVLQMQGLQTVNFGQKTAKHGVGFEVQIRNDLGTKVGLPKELSGLRKKEPTSEGEHYMGGEDALLNNTSITESYVWSRVKM
jgi:hypothetical protein